MGNVFTLDTIRDKAEQKYGSFDITLDDGSQVRLLNPLRLSKEKRKELVSVLDLLDAKDGEEAADQEDVLCDAIRAAAELPEQAEKLIAQIDGDLAVLAEIFSLYSAEAEVGEASASES